MQCWVRSVTKRNHAHQSQLATQSFWRVARFYLHIKLFTFSGFGHTKLFHMCGKRCLCDHMWDTEALPHGCTVSLQETPALCCRISLAEKFVVSKIECVDHLYTHFFASKTKIFCQSNILIFPWIDINFQFHVTRNVLGIFLFYWKVTNKCLSENGSFSDSEKPMYLFWAGHFVSHLCWIPHFC